MLLIEEYTRWLQALELVGESFVDRFTPKKGSLYSPREYHAFIWREFVFEPKRFFRDLNSVISVKWWLEAELSRYIQHPGPK
jgi:hypothetical protein